MTPDEAIGIAIRQSRMAQRLAQEEIGASQSFVSDVERGKKSLTVQRLDAFAKTLGIQPATLMIHAALISQPEMTIDELFETVRGELRRSCIDSQPPPSLAK